MYCRLRMCRVRVCRFRVNKVMVGWCSVCRVRLSLHDNLSALINSELMPRCRHKNLLQLYTRQSLAQWSRSCPQSGGYRGAHITHLQAHSLYRYVKYNVNYGSFFCKSHKKSREKMKRKKQLRRSYLELCPNKYIPYFTI
jgi:hypothetical protein